MQVSDELSQSRWRVERGVARVQDAPGRVVDIEEHGVKEPAGCPRIETGCTVIYFVEVTLL